MTICGAWASLLCKEGISDPAEEFLLKQIDLMFGGPELPSGLRIPVR